MAILRKIDEWENDFGMNGQVLEVVRDSDEDAIETAKQVLLEHGCGAWRGEEGCGAHPRWLAAGGLEFYVLTNRRIIATRGVVLAVLCDRHAGSLQNISRDMSELRRHVEMKELEDLIREAGVDPRAKIVTGVAFKRLAGPESE